MNSFLKIVITVPHRRENEGDEIAAMLDSCIDFVHLRKPEADIAEMRRLIESIPRRHHGKLRVHSHFELVDEYGLAGAHLNSRSPEYHGQSGTLTRSCHSLAEIAGSDIYQYVTLSPIFNSLSKPGYASSFVPEEISTQIRGKNVIALGGVTPAQFSRLHRTGFAGAAMLGYAWGATCPDELHNLLKIIKNAPIHN